MFNFFKKFKKECANTCAQLEKAESETKEPVKVEKTITAVIDGLLYDTSKAKRVGAYCVETDTMSAPNMEIDEYGFVILFCTHRGRFFMQQYGKLYPCDDLVAKNILKYYPDKYQEIFGKVEDA